LERAKLRLAPSRARAGSCPALALSSSDLDFEEEEKVLQKYAVSRDEGAFSIPPPLHTAEATFKEIAKNVGLLMKFKRVSF
jgi:hypothetical protein